MPPPLGTSRAPGLPVNSLTLSTPPHLSLPGFHLPIVPLQISFLIYTWRILMPSPFHRIKWLEGISRNTDPSLVMILITSYNVWGFTPRPNNSMTLAACPTTHFLHHLSASPALPLQTPVTSPGVTCASDPPAVDGRF